MTNASGGQPRKRPSTKKAAPKKAVKKKAPVKRAPVKKRVPVPVPVEEEEEVEEEVHERRTGNRETDRWSTWDKRVRDLLIFLLGLGAIVNEIWIESEPRLPGLVAGFALVGIPLTLYADEQRRSRP